MQDTIINKEGETSTVPRELYDDGTLMTVGGAGHGHKGSALSMMVDVLGGVLSGTGPSAGVPQERRPYFNNGTFFLCIDPTVFRQMDDFLDDIELMKGAHQTALLCSLQALDTDLSRTCTTLSGWSSLCLRGR